MNKPQLKTVYLPTSTNTKLYVGSIDEMDYYKSFVKESNVNEEQLITFTVEEYNNHIKEVIENTLETASEEAYTKTEESYAGSLGNENGELYDKTQVIDKESITNTLKQTFEQWKI